MSDDANKTEQLGAPDLPGSVPPSSPPPSEPQPVAPDSPLSRKRRWARIATYVGVVGLVLLLFGPLLLSRTILTPALRAGLGQGGTPGGLASASMGWTDGVHLERLTVPSPVEGQRPWVLLDEVAVDVSLARSLVSTIVGGTVPAKLVVGPGRIAMTLPLPPKADAAPVESEVTPEEAPKPDEGKKEPPTLPMALEPGLEVGPLDISVRWAPDPKVSPLDVELRGFVIKGACRVERDLGIDLREAFSVELGELRVSAERPEVLSAPIIVKGPKLTVSKLTLLAGPTPIAERLTLAMTFSVPSLEVERTVLTDVGIDLTIEAGKLGFGLHGACQGGKMSYRLAGGMVPRGGRLPLSMGVEITDVQLTGPISRAAPFLLPMLHATQANTAHGRSPGLPPLSLKAEGTVDLVSSSEGAFLLDDTLKTLAVPKGTLALGSGSFAASQALDGFARALVGLGVAPLLEGVFPAGMTFDGAAADFTLGAGKVTIPKIALRSKAVNLAAAAEVGFAGDYSMTIRSLNEGTPTPIDGLLKVLDQAGGVGIKGTLGKDGVEVITPSLDALSDSAKKQGLVDTLKSTKVGIDDVLKRAR